MDRLFLVIPCYNEEEVLPETSSRLLGQLEQMVRAGLVAADSRILFVDDGSKDKTWTIIAGLHEADPRFCGLKLSRNRGHQNALLAGLLEARRWADMVISLDADLQDDVQVLSQFVTKYHEGCDVVYGVRSSRASDSFFKRFTAEGFYRLMKGLGAETVFNHADYRLMSRRAIEGLAAFGEVNLFLRGIVPLIGYPSGVVTYERHERFAGQSKYPLKKMLAFAFEGITSLSVKPIRLITLLGVLIFTMSILFVLYFLVVHLLGRTVPGWTTIALSVWAIGGLQLLCMGVIGEYIGKIYLETKARPKYLIDQLLVDEEEAA